jgi:hypothetical protein
MAKLTDTQLIVLSKAAAREDGLATVSDGLNKAAASKIAASLVSRKLMREIRSKPVPLPSSSSRHTGMSGIVKICSEATLRVPWPWEWRRSRASRRFRAPCQTTWANANTELDFVGRCSRNSTRINQLTERDFSDGRDVERHHNAQARPCEYAKRALPNECKWPEGRASKSDASKRRSYNDPGGGARIAGQGLRCE